MSKTQRILSMAAIRRQGVTTRYVFNKLDDYDCIRNLRSYLSLLVKRGLLRLDGKLDCPGCGHPAFCYRITDAGRIHLNETRGDT